MTINLDTASETADKHQATQGSTATLLISRLRVDKGSQLTNYLTSRTADMLNCVENE